MPCETQYAYVVNLRQLRHVRLNTIIIISNISMKHHIKYENVWTNIAVQQ